MVAEITTYMLKTSADKLQENILFSSVKEKKMER
jgi:hypothetical protein